MRKSSGTGLLYIPALWFVEREETPLGYSKESVPVVSKNTGDEKLRTTLRGSVPERFFFKTLLSKRMYPFGFTEFDEVILPLEIVSSSQEAIENLEERLKRAKEFIKEFEEGIDDSADLDAMGALINLRCDAEQYLKSSHISPDAKKKIVNLLRENKHLFDYLNLELNEEILSFDEVEESEEIYKYRLLDYYDILEDFKSATERFYYWIEHTKKVPKNFKDWLINCQRVWEEWRGEKAQKMNIIDRLNYRNDLLSQPVKGGYLVLYTAGGSNPCACVVENEERLVVDHMTFYAHFNTYDEALYVASFINSSVLREMIREKQSRGLFGERHIHKLIVRQPIPKYDPEDPLHRKLVETARISTEKANEVRKQLVDVHPNRLRTEGRRLLSDELKAIDEIVSKILKT